MSAFSRDVFPGWQQYEPDEVFMLTVNHPAVPVPSLPAMYVPGINLDEMKANARDVVCERGTTLGGIPSVRIRYPGRFIEILIGKDSTPKGFWVEVEARRFVVLVTRRPEGEGEYIAPHETLFLGPFEAALTL